MSAPMQFDRPAPPGDQFAAETHVGALLVMEVLEHVPPMVTKVSDKPQDAIRANVYVIGAPGQVVEEFQNTLLFPRMLVSRLRQSVGRTVLGVLTGQPNVKRDGKNVPYDLDDPTPQMEAAAVAAMTARQMQSVQQQPQQAPPQQWGQQPATAPAQQGPWGQQPAGPPAQAPGGWQQPPAQQGPPAGYGQQPQQFQQPVQQQQAPAAGPWGQQPAPDQQYAAQQFGQQPPVQQGPPAGYGQQQLPPAQDDVPPWERDQQPAQPPWGQQ